MSRRFRIPNDADDVQQQFSSKVLYSYENERMIRYFMHRTRTSQDLIQYQSVLVPYRYSSTVYQEGGKIFYRYPTLNFF